VTFVFDEKTRDLQVWVELGIDKLIRVGTVKQHARGLLIEPSIKEGDYGYFPQGAQLHDGSILIDFVPLRTKKPEEQQ
jgi:hypothetical protein